MKNPWIAGILNLVLPGVGYLYLGVRKPFALLLIAGLIMSALMAVDPAVNELLASLYLSPAYVLSVLLMAGAFVVDAVLETKKVNSLSTKPKSASK